MAIPDEVAQYAEGHRIVSYFSLGEMEDGDQKKHQWLWTTISGSGQPYDFDSFRVFIWSLRRHRYETAYIERNIKGYAPVLVKEVEMANPSKGKGQPTAVSYPGFSICVEKADGQRYRREYAFLTNIIRFAGERSCEAQQPVFVPSSTALASATGQVPAPQKPDSWTEAFKKKLSATFKRWFHR
jgi:hypothetical protein